MSEQQLSLRLISNSKLVGVVIGKGGESIKGLRNETRTQINISTPPNSVSDPSRVIKKWEHNGEDKINVTVIVPGSQCSSLIGKGGSNIKRIRETSGAIVHIPSENLANSTEKGVSICGSATSAADAVYSICNTLVNNPVKNHNVPYDPNNFHSIQPPPPAESNFRMQVSDTGMGLSRIVESLSGYSNEAKATTPKNRYRTGGVIIKEDFNVPSDSVGCLIGKGGSTIREIRQLSDCSIKICNNEDGNFSSDGNGQTNVMISGEKEAVAVAKSLMNLTIDLNNMKRARESSDAENINASNHNPMRTNPWQNFETEASSHNLVMYPHVQSTMLMENGMKPMHMDTGVKRESGHGYATGNRSIEGYGPHYKKFRPNARDFM